MMQEFVQQIKDTVKEMTDGVHTAVPGTVTSFDAGTCQASVALSGQYRKPDGTKLPYPPAAHVPVVFPQAAGQSITIAYPVKPGDGCLVIFAEQALEAWRAGGESNLDLKHDLSNAIAIPGLFAAPNAVMQEAVAGDAVVIANQSTRLKVKGGKVEIIGDVTIEGELTVRGIDFTPHRHTGVTAGGDASGPPQK